MEQNLHLLALFMSEETNTTTVTIELNTIIITHHSNSGSVEYIHLFACIYILT